MDTNDITTRTLATMRDDITELRAGVDAGFKRVDAGFNRVDARIDGVEADMRAGFDQMGKRITDTEIRLATEIHAVQGTLQDLITILRARDRRRLPDD